MRNLSGRWRVVVVRAGLAFTLSAGALPAPGVENRFPRPEFETAHVTPAPTEPLPAAADRATQDAVVLLLLLVVAAVSLLHLRSRRLTVATALTALIYLGVYRNGCTCPVGSLQNVLAAVADPAFPLHWLALFFFVVPLTFTLLYGRVFCASVCPLGCLQDLLVVRPLRIPMWLNEVLGLARYVLLALTFVAVAGGLGFPLCRTDPYVVFFRLAGPPHAWVFGGAVLLLGAFLARPYCRFFCPYGLLHSWLAPLARRHVTITPDVCVNCRLCEQACPFDAIRKPVPPMPYARVRPEIRELALYAALLPALIATGTGAGLGLAPNLAQLHPDIRLAREVWLAESVDGKAPSLAALAFRSGTESDTRLTETAASAYVRFRTAAGVGGGLLGLGLGLSIVRLSRRPNRRFHQIDRMNCYACGRCFTYCPREQLRRRPGNARP